MRPSGWVLRTSTTWTSYNYRFMLSFGCVEAGTLTLKCSLAGVSVSSSRLRLSICFVLLGGLTGCGVDVTRGPLGSPTLVAYTFNGNSIPAAVATQIGSGAYTQATLTSNRLTVSIPADQTHYSVAYLCAPTTQGLFTIHEYIKQATLLDGTKFSETCAQSPVQGGSARVQVDASAIPSAGEINVGFGSGCSVCDTFDGDASLALGTYDVPITVDGNQGPYSPPLAVRILRNQMIPGSLNGGEPVVFQATDETVSQPITYTHVPDGYSLVSRTVVYNTAGGASVGLELNNSGPQLTQYLAMPSNTYQSGDYYDFLVFASATTGGATVSIENLTSSAGPQSFNFPLPWSYAGPLAATLPIFDFRYSGFSGMSDISYQAGISWSLGGPDGLDTGQISISATDNYQSGSTELSIPDLSSLTGFVATPTSGAAVLWSAGVYQGDTSLNRPAGGTIKGVYNSGSYTEP